MPDGMGRTSEASYGHVNLGGTSSQIEQPQPTGSAVGDHELASDRIPIPTPSPIRYAFEPRCKFAGGCKNFPSKYALDQHKGYCVGHIAQLKRGAKLKPLLGKQPLKHSWQTKQFYNPGDCKIQGCHNPKWAREMCSNHYSMDYKRRKDERVKLLTKVGKISEVSRYAAPPKPIDAFCEHCKGQMAETMEGILHLSPEQGVKCKREVQMANLEILRKAKELTLSTTQPSNNYPVHVMEELYRLMQFFPEYAESRLMREELFGMAESGYLQIDDNKVRLTKRGIDYVRAVRG